MNNPSFEEIVRKINTKDFAPIYLLMGEEAFYIDYIADLLANSVVESESRDLNQTIMYGKEVKADDIMRQAYRYPILSERQIVLVKELQGMEDNIDNLAKYVMKPQPTTVLVLCYKNGTIDKRKKIVDLIGSRGCVFLSPKLKDSQLPTFVANFTKKNDHKIDSDAAVVLSEFIGADLNRICNELKKLFLVCGTDKTIHKDTVLSHIGISKEYNTFELRNALANKNISKANGIVKYFEGDTKSFPIQMVLPTLFSFFSNLMLAYYAPQKDAKGVASYLKLRSEWQAKEYCQAMSLYTGRKVMSIINEIRITDAKSKGVGMRDTEHLLRDLVFYILH